MMVYRIKLSQDSMAAGYTDAFGHTNFGVMVEAESVSDAKDKVAEMYKISRTHLTHVQPRAYLYTFRCYIKHEDVLTRREDWDTTERGYTSQQATQWLARHIGQSAEVGPSGMVVYDKSDKS